MQVRVANYCEDFGRCGCGRSPTGFCNGWHGLTQEQYEIELEKYEVGAFDDEDEPL